MSTFAVFGMTRPVAFAEAKKRIKGTRKNLQAPGGVEQIPLAEWLTLVDRKTEQIMGGGTVRQLSPLFDAPQYAEQFIELARKTLQCRDMRIRSKAVLTDAKGKPIINPKTKAPKVGFAEWPPKQESKAAA
ncbi:hypothetical protein PS870_06399 [Pseudomonas fluorescens]|jgi:hypothetical protein|uniref:Uncharacterized protein n=1 Tax=Pseudomonas fluorescens TaxID=294 RepID=A0A5E7QHH4_PSEFL|nr:hypothetical protein [Pseudomonas fluorescens]VVP61656.1 hypothetical protein PS870_06399 [Pseudomonas fluorescens]